MPKISIVIPTYTRTDKLRECLTSIISMTNPEGVRVIVVANGATDDTGKAFDEFRNQWQGTAQLLWYDEPLGYTIAMNRGIEAAWDADFIVPLNDDCMFTANAKNLWLDMLLAPFDDPKMGITGPLMNWCPAAERHFLIFFCVMIRKTMLEEIGILDEIFNPGSGEDCDLSCRAIDSGWKIRQIPSEEPTPLVDKGCEDLPEWKRMKMHVSSWPGYHDGNATFQAIPEIYEPTMRRNHEILRERYGNKVNAPTGGCERCGGPMLDGVCIGAESKLNCDGLYLWRASVIDGWFGCDEGEWIAAQVKALPPNSKVCSVGAWHGRSSRFIADNLSEGSQLWDFDHWRGSSGEPEMHGSANENLGDHAMSWYYCNLAEHIHKGRVIPVRMHSANAAATFAHLIEKEQMEKFSLVFIDGDHSAEGIQTDVEAWFPLLQDNGLICGHDYYKEGDGLSWVFVRQYVEQKFPDVQKAATSIWWTRKALANPHQAELDYQIQSQCNDPEYVNVVESSQRTIIGQMFAGISPNATILDVGCGSGVTMDILYLNGFITVAGIDISPNLASAAWQGDMHNMAMFDADSFDIIYCSHTLEHAYDPMKALAEFKRVLKPDGKLFIVLPYPDVIDSEHRAKAHCGSEVLGLTIHDNAITLINTIQAAGFVISEMEMGNLRGEPEIYLQFDVARPRIFDCFIYNDEEEVLQIRLATLNDVVSRFILVEGTLTHSGKPKPLHFDLNKDCYAQYLHKITHIIVDDYPEFPEPTNLQSQADQAWARERHQRDSIMHGLTNCWPDDVIFIGDADEIANPEAIRSYDPSQGLCRLKQRLFYYYLNCENKEGWDWQKIAPYSVVKALRPCGVRYPPAGHTPLIENGGWHFSFATDVDGIISKIQSYAHVEYATDEILNRERIEQLIAKGEDIFGRGDKYEFVEIDENYPQYIKDRVDELTVKGLIKQYPLASLMLPPNMFERSPIMQGNDSLSIHKHWTVTAEVSTKDRYHVLPTCLTAIITQTRKPDKLVIYDDGELTPEQLVEKSPFKGLFQMCDELQIPWEVFATPKLGQVTNHQHALDTATTDFIWRVDDDEVPMPDCLERLLNTVRDYGRGGEFDSIGAVGGLVLNPTSMGEMPPFLDGTLKDVQAGLNLSWYRWNGGPREVEHLYSTFLYRVDAARKAGGYPKNLSPVGHREETIFTHLIHRAGWKLLIDPRAVTYHIRQPTGGIRSYA